jgi:adenylate cyclase
MPNRLFRFWQELRRRHVIKVFIWYAGIAMVLIGLASDMAGPFNLPDGTLRLVIILIIIGFPVAMILAWIFDISPEGFQRTSSLEAEQRVNKDLRTAVHDGSYDGSIAVLPFQDMSPEKDQEYFCDGISEEIINALTQVEELKVIARTSAFAFKGKQMDIREIGNILNVEHVLEGSIRKDRDQLRITAQLIRVEDGFHLWSEAYNRKLQDIFSIQEEISMTIVEKLKVKLGKDNKAVMLKRHTENHEAYQLYLKGFYYWQKMTPEGNQKAQEYYLKALEADPGYALVYSILGSNFMFAGLLGFIPPEVAVQNGREYTNKALAIDNSISVAFSTLGAISLAFDWDLEAAEERFYRSVQLNPNSAWDRFFYSFYLRYAHRYDEAIADSSFVLEKDPFNIYICTEIGVTYLMAGRIDEAIERQQLTINIYPEGFLAHLHLGEAQEVKGQLDLAIESYEKASILSNGSPMAETALACAWHKAGRTEEARGKIEKVEQMMKAVYVSSSLLVPYYLLLKDHDRAYYWLKKACDQRDFSLIVLLNSPNEDHRMPDDPRFNDLLEKTGLNKYQIQRPI